MSVRTHKYMYQGELYIYLPANSGYAQDWTRISEAPSEKQVFLLLLLLLLLLSVITILQARIRVSVVPWLQPDG